MKKVLLGILAFGALVISCQDYDEEFASLNQKIANLETQVATIASLQSAITSLQSNVGNMQASLSGLVADVDALAADVEGLGDLSGLMDEVETLGTQLTALQAAVANASTQEELDAFKDEILGLVDTLSDAIVENADAIADVLSAVEGLDADQAAALAAVKKELVDAIAGVAADNTKLAAALAALATENDEIKVLIAALSTQNTAFAAQMVALSADNAALKATLATLAANDTAFAAQLAAVAAANETLKASVDAIIGLNATYTGDLIITNASQLAFAQSLGSKVQTINGDLFIQIDETTNPISATAVSGVTSLIKNVVGNVGIVTDASIDLSALTAVNGDYAVQGNDIDDSALASVGGDFAVSYDGPYLYPALITVGEGIEIKNFTKSASGVTPVVVGTTAVDFSGITSVKASEGIRTDSSEPTVTEATITGNGTGFAVNGGTLGNLILDSASSIAIGDVAVLVLTADAATSVSLGFDGVLASLDINNAVVSPATSKTLTSVTVLAKGVGTGTVAAPTSTGGASVDIESLATGTVSLPNLLWAGAIVLEGQPSAPSLQHAESLTLDDATSFSGFAALKGVSASFTYAAATGFTPTGTGGALSGPEVTEAISSSNLVLAGDVDFIKATSLVATNAVVTTIDMSTTSTDKVSIDLGMSTTPPDEVNIETLNLHSYTGTNTLTVSTTALTGLVNLTVIGKATTTANASTGSTNDLTVTETGGTSLKNIVLMGALDDVTLTDTDNVTSLSTSGTISHLIIDGADSLETVSLAHTEDPAKGSRLVVKNNEKLTTFTTAIDRVLEFEVTGNPLLASFDASSMKTLPTNSVLGTATGSYRFVIGGAEPATTSSQSTLTTNASLNNTTQTANSATPPDAGLVAGSKGFVGAYTSAVAVGVSNPAADQIFGSASLATLEPYLLLIANSITATTADTIFVVPGDLASGKVILDINYYAPNPATPTELILIPIARSAAGFMSLHNPASVGALAADGATGAAISATEKANLIDTLNDISS